MISVDLANLKRRIQAASEQAGRRAEEIDLVLVTKAVEPKRIFEAYELGHRKFGENKVQELLAKQSELPKDIEWHFIGSLQTNKAKDLIGAVRLIHSCARIELAREIEKQAEKRNQKVDALIQVNASGEATKHGFAPIQVKRAVSEMAGFAHLNIEGLMTIGPNTDNKEQIKQTFETLRRLRDELKTAFPAHSWKHLSMGMSSDFEIAIEAGANLLRIGSAVFGARKNVQ